MIPQQHVHTISHVKECSLLTCKLQLANVMSLWAKCYILVRYAHDKLVDGKLNLC